MKLLFKFNLAFLLLFLLGIAACGYITRDMLQRNAREEITRCDPTNSNAHSAIANTGSIGIASRISANW